MLILFLDASIEPKLCCRMRKTRKDNKMVLCAMKLRTKLTNKVLGASRTT